MTRRTFLQQSLGGSALIAAAATGPAMAQTQSPLSLGAFEIDAATAFATRLATVTAGSLAIDPVEAPAADGATLFGRVAAGDLDMAVINPRDLIGLSPAFGMYEAMPFGLGSGEVEGWLSASDGTEMLERLTEGSGLSIRLISDRGAMPLWSNRALNDGADLSGLRIGARGLAIQCLQNAGAAQVADLDDPATDWADLDIVEGASALEMRDRGLMAALPFVAQVNPMTPSSFSALIVNDARRDALSASQRDLLETACAAELALSRGRAFHRNTTAMVEAGDAVRRYELGAGLWRDLRAASQTLLGDIFASGDNEAAVVDAYVYFLGDIAPWSEIGEAAYYSGRKRVLGA